MNNDNSELRYSITYRDAVRILDLVKNSTDLTSLSFECGDLKLAVERRTESTIRAPLDEARSSFAAPVSQSPSVIAPQPSGSKTEVCDDNRGVVTIRAPMLGTFYCTSAPGEAPYVVVGQTISPDDTIGLIEVMKLFTPVNAGVDGVVEEILAVHGEMVEYDQPLLRVRPQ